MPSTRRCSHRVPLLEEAHPRSGDEAGCNPQVAADLALAYAYGWGRRQNLNPEPKINLNHANLKPPNLWAVVSQEFARFTQEFHSNQVSRFDVDRAHRQIL